MVVSIELKERREQMFPRLEGKALARLVALGQRRRVLAGEILFEQGDRNTHFYVVLSGSLEVVRPSQTGTEEVVRVHGPGEFAGEVNVLLGRASLARGRMREDGEVSVLDRDRLRQVVVVDSELSDILMRAFILRRVALIAQQKGDVTLVGSRHSGRTLRLREFLTRNGYPHVYLDLETEPGVLELLDRSHVGVRDIPVVICRGETVLRNPEIPDLAETLGLRADWDERTVRDVVVVGAGPSGLATAVYAASEGLDTLVLEAESPGGQAGCSSKIENYLGFPTGISGEALAGRAFTQAAKFGAEISVARTAVHLDCSKWPYALAVDGGRTVCTRSVVVASGARYRRLPLPELERFDNNGVYYAATPVEAQLCGGEEVVVVGGGNSAGQAAVFLSQRARHVHMLVRSGGLAESMSRYLICRIKDTPNITLRTHTELVAMEGDDHLEQVRWRAEGGEIETRPLRHVFLMTGADPNTPWLGGCLQLDGHGFVKTGSDLSREELQAAQWPLARAPYPLESSLRGVFAVGDIRSGSVKRVAAAVGEGSACVQLIHKILRE